MKKLYSLLFFTALLSVTQVKAQVVFNETFDGISGSTAGGAGTYAFPAGWKLVNVDNRTPNGQVAYVNNAWTRREDFLFNVSDSCAFSTSYYSPSGSADDWMWTPAINLAAGSTAYKLTWNAVTYDPSYPDGYEVRIMTIVPTGVTGSLGNMVSASTVLFSTTAEATTWQARSVDIPATYNGGVVYIGFRNNSNDKFLLLIDDIKVERPPASDAAVTARSTYQFSTYPITQAAPMAITGTVQNVGGTSLTNVNLGAKVYNRNGTVISTITGTPIATLAAGASQSFTLPSYTPASADSFTIKYYPIATQTDLNTANDTLATIFVVSDSAFARDRGAATGSLGIGAGDGGYLGQNYTVNTTAALSSISVSYAQGYVGKKYAAAIWNTDGTGKPTTLFATTDTLLYPSDNPLDAVLGISGGARAIPAGVYAVTAIEFDSTLAVVQTTDIFTIGTTWVNWPTSPLGTWGNNEAFGAGFAKPYKIRMNLRSLGTLPVKLNSFTGILAGKNNQLTWNVGTQSGITSYDVMRSADNVNFTSVYNTRATAAEEQRYSFTDMSVNGSFYYRIRINENGRPTTYSNVVLLKRTPVADLLISPNPVSTTAVIRLNETGAINTTGKLIDASGKVVLKVKITGPVTNLNMKAVAPGTYIFQLEDGRTFRLVKL